MLSVTLLPLFDFISVAYPDMNMNMNISREKEREGEAEKNARIKI